MPASLILRNCSSLKDSNVDFMKDKKRQPWNYILLLGRGKKISTRSWLLPSLLLNLLSIQPRTASNLELIHASTCCGGQAALSKCCPFYWQLAKCNRGWVEGEAGILGLFWLKLKAAQQAAGSVTGSMVGSRAEVQEAPLVWLIAGFSHKTSKSMRWNWWGAFKLKHCRGRLLWHS